AGDAAAGFARTLLGTGFEPLEAPKNSQGPGHLEWSPGCLTDPVNFVREPQLVAVLGQGQGQTRQRILPRSGRQVGGLQHAADARRVRGPALQRAPHAFHPGRPALPVCGAALTEGRLVDAIGRQGIAVVVDPVAALGGFTAGPLPVGAALHAVADASAALSLAAGGAWGEAWSKGAVEVAGTLAAGTGEP